MAGIADLLYALGQGNQGYQAGQQQQLAQALNAIKLSQAQTGQQGSDFRGDALNTMYGAPAPSAAQPQAIPGQASMPPALQPPMPGQQSQPMVRPPVNMNPAPPPGGAAPPPQSPDAQAGQGLSWRQIVQSIKQAHPEAKGAALAEAVDQFVPMMNSQSKAEWQQVQLQIKERDLDLKKDVLAERERNNDMMNSYRSQQADTAAKKIPIEQQRADAGTSRAGTYAKNSDIRSEKNDAEEDYKVNALEVNNINKDIKDMGVPPKDSPQYSEYQALVRKRDDIVNKMMSAKKANPRFPMPSQAVASAKPPAADPILKVTGTKQNPLQPTTQEEINNAPSGAVMLIDGKLYTK